MGDNCVPTLIGYEDRNGRIVSGVSGSEEVYHF